MADRIKVLFLIDYFHRTGGTEQHLFQLVSGLSRAGFSCTVVVFDIGENALLGELRAGGIPIIHLPVGREYVPNALVQGVRLARLIRAGRFDVVQTFHQKSDTYGALIAWLAGARHLVSSKRDTGELRKPLHVFLNRRLRGLFDAFIMTAERVRVAVAARDRLPAARITTIYNGADLVRFGVPSGRQKAAARAALGLARDDFVVGMVAAFRPEKRHDLFLRAMADALAVIPALRVLAVGDGPLLGPLRERLAAEPLGARTVFTGAVRDVVPLLWAMDVGCLTPDVNEGFSNAVIEEMAVGLPLIVTDVGGNAEAVVDGESGFVVPPRDPAAIVGALTRLHADRALAAAMGRAARERAQRLFSVDAMCARHARLYASLCGAGRERLTADAGAGD